MFLVVGEILELPCAARNKRCLRKLITKCKKARSRNHEQFEKKKVNYDNIKKINTHPKTVELQRQKQNENKLRKL